jgi:hypothetical protein
MPGRSDNTDLVLLLGAALLAALGHSIFDILLEEWIKQRLEDYFGFTVAEVIERFGSIAIPTLLAIAIIWIMVRVIKRDYEKQLKAAKAALEKGGPAFEFVYDPANPRWVSADSQKTRYCIGLRILSRQTIDHPNIWALEGPFTKRIFSRIAKEINPAGAVMIYSGGAIDPSVTEPIELFGLPTSKQYLAIKGPDDPLRSVQRFTLEARGRHCEPVRAQFEYDPDRTPMIRMLP